MLDISVHNNSIQIGPHFSVDFQRTLRIPDDEGTYPLPPGLGSFPIYRVEDYASPYSSPARDNPKMNCIAILEERCVLFFSGQERRGRLSPSSGLTRESKIGQHIPLLLPQGGNGGHHALRKPTPRFAVGTEDAQIWGLTGTTTSTCSTGNRRRPCPS